MNEKYIAKFLPIAAAVVGALAILLWMRSGPGTPLKERMPGADRAEGAGPAASTWKWEGKVVKSTGTPANLPGAWPRFRGPNYDDIGPDTQPTLARAWPADGPPVLWRKDAGEGYAPPVIWQGRVFLMDYDREATSDALRCLSLADGQEIWRYTYPLKVKRNHGMSRTAPTVTDKGVVAMGPKCHVICVHPLTGELIWKLDLVREFNFEVPQWYAGQCPFVDGDRVILGVGGDALVIAVDLATGKILWKTPNPRQWAMTHSSIAPMDLQGRKTYVYCGSGGVAGVAADDGSILWDTTDWRISIANIPTPLPVGEGRVFLCGGYEAGSMMLRVQSAGSKATVTNLIRLKPKVYGSTQQTPILFQGHIIGVRPDPDAQLVCLGLDGKAVWESGPANRFGSGPYLMAQNLIYVMNDKGVLTLAEASLTGYKQLAQAKVLNGHDSWGPMALAGGRLLVRDMNQLACLDVAAH